MASRRVRIKGIANIPQRKKANAPESEPASEIGDEPQQNGTGGCEKGPNLNSGLESHVEVLSTRTAVSDIRENVEANGKVEVQEENELERKDTKNEETKTTSPIVNTKDDATKVNIAEIATKSLPIRRKFIKPQVAVSSISRKKEKTESVAAEPNKENVQEIVNVNLNETVIAPSSTPSKIDQTPSPLNVKISPTVIPQKDISKPSSDTEYPPPPVSPSKLLNRRIKAIPKLHQRRTSFSIGSASESEDDSRRGTYGRIRNDSICSVASVATDTQAPIKEAASPARKEVSSNPPRKARRSDQGRKIAEARRNFYRKFADGKPDKQKLTMIDLIYYNPSTNPMNPRKRRETTSSSICEEAASPKPITSANEESVDDPNHINSEEDDDVLAPQIKVGPNGEIVIDEKSLVIENVETKRSRQAMEMAEVIDGDCDTSYGVCKRVKRAKDWLNEETLRFYKALNTIGTDFTMMCELFPTRTRRELKLKFKREEKINKTLVDRAVMQPVEFDMSQLRKDLEEQERYEEEKRKRVEETKLAREKKKLKMQERKYEKKQSLTGVDAADLEECEGSVTVVKDKRLRRKRKKKHPYDNLKKGIDSLLEDTDDSDEEYKPNLTEKKNGVKRATIPRETRKSSTENDENTAKHLEPGSLMIIPSSQSGKALYKVFMVTEEHNKQDAEMDGNITEKIPSEKTINIQNIITISENAIENLETPQIGTGDIQISENSIIFDFDECLGPATNNNSNITISHDDNKMTIVTES